MTCEMRYKYLSKMEIATLVLEIHERGHGFDSKECEQLPTISLPTYIVPTYMPQLRINAPGSKLVHRE